MRVNHPPQEPAVGHTDRGPVHAAAMVVGQRFDTRFVARIIQVGVDRSRDGPRILERSEVTAPLAQHLARVHEGSGHHRFPARHRVRQRATHDLSRVQVRQDVHIGGLQEAEQLRRAQIAVEEAHVVLQAELVHQRRQHLTIRFSRVPPLARMGLPQDEVDHVWVAGDDLWQRTNGMLDALVGSEQAERGQHGLPFQAQLVLIASRRLAAHHGRAVGNERHLVEVGARVVLGENLACALRQHNHCGRLLDELLRDAAQRGVRLLQHGVHGQHDGAVHGLDEVEQILASLAAEEPVLMLDGDGLCARRRIHVLRGPQIIGAIIAVDGQAHLWAIVMVLPPIVHRDDPGGRS